MKTFLRLCLAACAVQALVSCYTLDPAMTPPVPGSPGSVSVSMPSASMPVLSVTLPSGAATTMISTSPNIAGVWKGPSATITIGTSNGSSFPMSMTRKGGQAHSCTGHWAPGYRSFTFVRSNGTQATGMLESMNPRTLAIEGEDGRIRPWTRQ